MCEDCLAEHFADGRSVPPITDAMATLVADIGKLYEAGTNGGNLHVVVDDWNLDDGSVRWCLYSPDAAPLTRFERSIAERLLALPEDERHAVLAARL